MPRPVYCRRVAGKPGACVFKPAGVAACRLEWLNLTLDEFEAMRLADLDGLHQEEAAARMKYPARRSAALSRTPAARSRRL